MSIFNAIIGAVGKKILAKGLSAAFPEEISQPAIQRPNVNFREARTFRPDEAGVGDATFGDMTFDTTSYDSHLLAWERRLFGGSDSYTGDITLPKIGG